MHTIIQISFINSCTRAGNLPAAALLSVPAAAFLSAPAAAATRDGTASMHLHPTPATARHSLSSPLVLCNHVVCSERWRQWGHGALGPSPYNRACMTCTRNTPASLCGGFK